MNTMVNIHSVTIWTIVLFSNDFNGHADKWTLASCNSNCSPTMTHVLVPL